MEYCSKCYFATKCADIHGRKKQCMISIFCFFALNNAQPLKPINMSHFLKYRDDKKSTNLTIQ